MEDEGERDGAGGGGWGGVGGQRGGAVRGEGRVVAWHSGEGPADQRGGAGVVAQQRAGDRAVAVQ